MRRIHLFLVLVFSIGFSHSALALESRCFTEYAELSIQSPVEQIFATDRTRDDIFFTQEGRILPSRENNTLQRESYGYKLRSTIPLSGTGVLIDDIVTTAIEVQPTAAPTGFSMALEFDTPMVRDTFIPVLDIVTQGVVTTSISSDGQTYVNVASHRLSEYDFGYLRIDIVPRANGIVSTHILRTIRFDKKQQKFYRVKPVSTAPIVAYRGWVCDSTKLSTLRISRDNLGQSIDTQKPITSSVRIQFSPLPIEGKDTDGDTIIDMRDNCSLVVNRDQNDRNYDGIGDACSDDDKDGIIGDKDNCPTVANRDQKDLNNNKIGDACEFDSDNDTVADGVDNCIRIANTDQLDRDSDGVGDACDNCTLYNPDQLDTDKTGVGDICEQVEKSKKENDKDGDTIIDQLDNCPEVANRDQLDTDADGIGDACDNCRSIQNRDQYDSDKNSVGDMCEDIDSDGIYGWRDNCPSIANPDQLDADNDMVGNVCTDTDSDDIYDGADNCPLVHNSDQKDIDADGIGDMCDTTDNRFIESNKVFFMILFACISLVFIGGIVFFLRKVQL